MKQEKAIDSLSALAQETRLSIFLLLMDIGEEGMSAGSLSEHLEIQPTTLSFHLSQLKNANLIDSKKEGRSVIYCANRKKIKKLCNYILAKK